jgi:hypothetical protein
MFISHSLTGRLSATEDHVRTLRAQNVELREAALALAAMMHRLASETIQDRTERISFLQRLTDVTACIQAI